MITQKGIDELEKAFITKIDLKEALVQLKSDIFDKFDAFIKEVKDSHEERLLVSHKLSEIEDRVEKLESTQTN